MIIINKNSNNLHMNEKNLTRICIQTILYKFSGNRGYQSPCLAGLMGHPYAYCAFKGRGVSLCHILIRQCNKK